MNGDALAELVGGVDGGFDLVVVEGLEAGDVVVGAGGGVELDPVGAGGDLLADDAEDFGDAIGDAACGSGDSANGGIDTGLVGGAGNVQAVANDEHARADHFALVDEIAHGDIHILIGAEIADGGDAVFERAHRAFAGEEDFGGGWVGGDLLEHGDAGSFVGVNRHVGVDVDEAGEAGVFAEVDDLGCGWDGGGVGGDGADFCAVDDDDGVGPDFVAVPELAELYGFGLGLRGGVGLGVDSIRGRK